MELLPRVEQAGNLQNGLVDGEPTVDMLGVEPRRYGDYATKSYLKEKNEEAYRSRICQFIILMKKEVLLARPLRTCPML